jgi:hypothetical protein
VWRVAGGEWPVVKDASSVKGEACSEASRKRQLPVENVNRGVRRGSWIAKATKRESWIVDRGWNKAHLRCGHVSRPGHADDRRSPRGDWPNLESGGRRGELVRRPAHKKPIVDHEAWKPSFFWCISPLLSPELSPDRSERVPCWSIFSRVNDRRLDSDQRPVEAIDTIAAYVVASEVKTVIGIGSLNRHNDS